MSWFANLRLYALVRRGVIALESIADSQRILSNLAQQTRDRRDARLTRRAKPVATDFATMDVREINRAYHRDLIAQGLAAPGDFPEDDA